jgi:hypothetical protein
VGDVYQKGKVEFELNSKVGNILPSCAKASDDYRSWRLEVRDCHPTLKLRMIREDGSLIKTSVKF